MDLKDLAKARIKQLIINGMYVICIAFFLPILSVNIPVTSRPTGHTSNVILAEILMKTQIY